MASVWQHESCRMAEHLTDLILIYGTTACLQRTIRSINLYLEWHMTVWHQPMHAQFTSDSLLSCHAPEDHIEF